MSKILLSCAAEPEVRTAQPHSSLVVQAEPLEWPRLSYAWYVVGVLVTAYIFAMIDRVSVGLLAAEIQADMGLSDTDLSLLQGFAFAIFYTTLGLPCGWLADRTSRRNLLVFGVTAWSVATVACGLATTFGQLFVARIAVGIGEATLAPTVTSLIADYFAPKQRASAYSVYQVSLAIGSAIAWLVGGQLLGWLQVLPPLDLPIIGRVEPWQATMIGVGAPGVGVALLILLTVREPSRQNRSGIGDASWKTALKFIAQHKYTVACHHVGLAMAILGLYAWLAWLPTFFTRIFAWSVPESTRWFAVCIGVTGFLSSAASGSIVRGLSNRGRSDATLIGVIIGVCGSTIFGTLMFLMPHPGLSLAMLALCGLFIVFAPACGLASLMEIAPNEIRAKCTAIYLMTLGLLSVAEGPLFVALLTDEVFVNPSSVGVSAALVVGISGSIGVVVLLLGMKPYRASVKLAATWRGK